MLDDVGSSECESCLGDCVATLGAEASAYAGALPDTRDEASNTEDVHCHVYMNSLDDDFERWEGAREGALGYRGGQASQIHPRRVNPPASQGGFFIMECRVTCHFVVHIHVLQTQPIKRPRF